MLYLYPDMTHPFDDLAEAMAVAEIINAMVATRDEKGDWYYVSVVGTGNAPIPTKGDE